MLNPIDIGHHSDVPSLEEPLAGSSAQDSTSHALGIILIVVGCAILFLSPTPRGLVRIPIDFLALLAILAGIIQFVTAGRRQRIRSGCAPPNDLWKEALRAEKERDFDEAVRLYTEIIRLHPSTTWSSDAVSSIELLRKEGKT